MPAYSMYIYSLQNYLCVGRSSKVLREVALNIIRHEKCNQILKEIQGKVFAVVQEGGVCGYNEKGGDACQVSLSVPCCSAPQSFPLKPQILHLLLIQSLVLSQILHLLLFKIMEWQVKPPQLLG